MVHPLAAVLLAIVCAMIGAAAAARHIEANARTRLALAQVDIFSYVAGVGGALSLIPEVLQAFAPELLSRRLVGGVFENLDYAAYVLVPIGFGSGVARRWYAILIERAATSAPAAI